MHLSSIKDLPPLGLKGLPSSFILHRQYLKFVLTILTPQLNMFQTVIIFSRTELNTPFKPAVGECLITKTDFRQTIWSTFSMDPTYQGHQQEILFNYAKKWNGYHAWDYETRQNTVRQINKVLMDTMWASNKKMTIINNITMFYKTDDKLDS